MSIQYCQKNSEIKYPILVIFFEDNKTPNKVTKIVVKKIMPPPSVTKIILDAKTYTNKVIYTYIYHLKSR